MTRFISACNPINDGERPIKKSVTAPKILGYICWVCGREFGTASIGIHEPKCEKLWNAREATKPHSMQRPPLVKPEGLDSATTKKARNEIARSHHMSVMMESCFLCPRTFAEGRLKKHLA